MHREISSYYDGTDEYVTRQENDHYVYHNAMKVAIPNRCLSTKTPENVRPTKKGVQEVCKPTGGSILAHVDYVYNPNSGVTY